MSEPSAVPRLIRDPSLVTCPAGCLRPSLIPGRGPLPVLCDPVYDGHGEGTAPFATGRFRCPHCRREHTPSTTSEQETSS
jgi:hypothetical protein